MNTSGDRSIEEVSRDPRKLHFVGIGGAGMAPLALLALDNGYRVSGSDLVSNAKTVELRKRGMTVYRGHAAGNVSPDVAMLVYSSAVAEDNPERVAAARFGIPQIRRGEFLAELAKRYRRVAAISGAHGKSSTTALLAHILTVVGVAPGFLIGAELNGGGSFSPGKDRDIFVTEVDESDGTHTFIRPALGLVPNIEEDHAWSVGGAAALLENYRIFGNNCGRLIYCAGEYPDKIFAGHPNALRLEELPEEYLGFFGFQAANAFLAVAGARELGIPKKDAERAARSFPGIGRRMNIRRTSEKLVVVEDYAHHPSEIAAALKMLRFRYPRYHLRVLVQPHRYARLEYFFDDFVRELGKADSALILPVFAAWSESGKIDSRDLADAIGGAVSLNCGWPEVARIAALPPADGRPMVLAVLGAGDIERVFDFL